MWEIIRIYLGISIDIFSVLLFGKIVLNDSRKRIEKKQIALLILLSIIQTIIYINFDGTLKTIAMFISNLFFYKYMFNISFSKSILMVFLYMILLIVAINIV